MSKLLSRLLVAGLFAFAVNTNAAELKIGYVQVDKILQEAPQTAESGKKLEKEFSPRTQDLERLQKQIKDIETSLDKDALKEAAKILIYHFMLFSDEKITLDTEEKRNDEEFDESSLHMRQLLKTKLVDMDLSVRALNCLKAADVETLGELVSFNKNDLLKFRNFGKKSLTELEDLVQAKTLQFGMNVAKYKLDKD